MGSPIAAELRPNRSNAKAPCHAETNGELHLKKFEKNFPQCMENRSCSDWFFLKELWRAIPERDVEMVPGIVRADRLAS
jgi:hypothetical protein